MLEDEPGPSHDSAHGVSIKITTGYRLIMEFSDKGLRTRFDRRNFYWKHGMSHEAHRWLKTNFGPQCGSRAAWDNEDSEDGQWLYLGTQIRKKSQLRTVTLQFRNKSQAMLFKLAWASRL